MCRVYVSMICIDTRAQICLFLAGAYNFSLNCISQASRFRHWHELNNDLSSEFGAFLDIIIQLLKRNKSLL